MKFGLYLLLYYYLFITIGFILSHYKTKPLFPLAVAAKLTQ